MYYRYKNYGYDRSRKDRHELQATGGETETLGPETMPTGARQKLETGGYITAGGYFAHEIKNQ